MAVNKEKWPISISRRNFLKASAIATGGLAGASTLSWSSKMGGLTTKASASSNATIVPTSCIHNCGGRCPLYAHVEDGVITRITSDQSGVDSPDFPQARACLRGRAQRNRLYHPDRLKYPMKRVGKRGEGKFERISWDEALDTIAEQMERIKKTYGNEAIYIMYGTGVYGQISQSWITPNFGGALPRFLNMFGGYLGYYNTYSSAYYSTAAPYTFGNAAGNSADDMVNSKLIVLFADNPGETRLGGANGHYYLRKAKEAGAKMIVIDPRYSDTVASVADEWIPIRPTTDNALIDAIAYVLLQENLHDQAFPLKEKYPLQLIGHHYKRRVHSTFDNVPWMEEAARQELWLNTGDAAARGIKDGDLVRVFNDRGKVVLPAKVTPRIMPGVASMPQGAWWAPDAQGVDRRGNVNTLTKYHPTPLARGNPQHTNLVEVVKA